MRSHNQTLLPGRRLYTRATVSLSWREQAACEQAGREGERERSKGGETKEETREGVPLLVTPRSST